MVQPLTIWVKSSVLMVALNRVETIARRLTKEMKMEGIKASRLLASLIVMTLLCGCATRFNFPIGKTQQDFHNDVNECKALQMRIDFRDDAIMTSCLLGKGYTIAK